MSLILLNSSQNAAIPVSLAEGRTGIGGLNGGGGRGANSASNAGCFTNGELAAFAIVKRLA